MSPNVFVLWRQSIALVLWWETPPPQENMLQLIVFCAASSVCKFAKSSNFFTCQQWMSLQLSSMRHISLSNVSRFFPNKTRANPDLLVWSMDKFALCESPMMDMGEKCHQHLFDISFMRWRRVDSAIQILKSWDCASCELMSEFSSVKEW